MSGPDSLRESDLPAGGALVQPEQKQMDTPAETPAEKPGMPGVGFLRAFKEMLDAGMPMQENPDVRKMCEKMYDMARSCAAKAYPDEDFGFEKVETKAEGDEPGEKADDPDEDADEFTDEEDALVKSLTERFETITGERVRI